jgi:competence protein ComEA
VNPVPALAPFHNTVWCMDDRRAALLLAGLALAGAAVRYCLRPAVPRAPGDVQLLAVDTPPPSALQETARRAAELARPLAPGERIDVDRADVITLTRLPRVGPALARRILDWRERNGPFRSLERLDSVPGVGPKLLDALRPHVMFSGALP